MELRGPLDRARPASAPSPRVVARHESLRMTVSTEPLGLRLAADMEVPIDLQRPRGASRGRARDAHFRRCSGPATASRSIWRKGRWSRLTLVPRWPPTTTCSSWSAHHLVCDGWSFGIVLRDLAALVLGRRSSRRRATCRRPAGAALRPRRSRAEATARKRRGRSVLDEAVPRPSPIRWSCRPIGRARPSGRTAAARFSVQFDGPLATQLKKLASQHRTTLFTTLLAAFETLVYRLTGQDDFVVGIPVACAVDDRRRGSGRALRQLRPAARDGPAGRRPFRSISTPAEARRSTSASIRTSPTAACWRSCRLPHAAGPRSAGVDQLHARARDRESRVSRPRVAER